MLTARTQLRPGALGQWAVHTARSPDFDSRHYDGYRIRIGEGDDSRDWNYSRWYTQGW